MIVAPNSPSPRANASAAPAPRPPLASGSTTRKKTRPRPAPSARAAQEAWVDRLEGRNGSAQVEGLATNVTARTTATFERDVDAKRVDGPAEQPCAAEGDEEADAGHRRREHERQLDERDEYVSRAASAVRDPYAAGSRTRG